LNATGPGEGNRFITRCPLLFSVTDVVLMFEVHQPYRLRRFLDHCLARLAVRGEKPGEHELERLYFDDELNRRVLTKVAGRCYMPATSLFLSLLDEYEGFRLSLSFSGVLLEQVERWSPDLMELFRQIARHPRVELLGQTYYHSLAFLIDEEEFVEQVLEHREALRSLLGAEASTFENTEFIYNNRVAALARGIGYDVVMTEGVQRVLGRRSPNYVYRSREGEVRVLLRNYTLSDDIGFRFASRDWREYPLTASKYAAWLAATPGDVICICMDYETIGEHFPAETGIFEFFRWLPHEVLKYDRLRFSTPRGAAFSHEPVDVLDVPEHDTISWADEERDLSAWLMNSMQRRSFEELRGLRLLARYSGRKAIYRVWRLLSMSDHFYYMSTKGGGSGEVHSYFSPYPTPVDAFTAFHDAVMDLERRLERVYRGRRKAFAWLRGVPEPHAFYFTLPEGVYTGLAARCGVDLVRLVDRLPEKSLEYHVQSGHLQEWLRTEVGDSEAAELVEGLKGLRGQQLKEAFRECLHRHLRDALPGDVF